MTSCLFEVVGTVVDATTIKLLRCINFGSPLGGMLSLMHVTILSVTTSHIVDMAIVKKVIDLTFDPKFKGSR